MGLSIRGVSPEHVPEAFRAVINACNSCDHMLLRECPGGDITVSIFNKDELDLYTRRLRERATPFPDTCPIFSCGLKINGVTHKFRYKENVRLLKL